MPNRANTDKELAKLVDHEDRIRLLEGRRFPRPERNAGPAPTGSFDDFIQLEIAGSAPTITGTGTLNVDDWAISNQGSGSLVWPGADDTRIEGFVVGGLYSIVAFAQSSGYANGDYAQILLLLNSLVGPNGGARHVKASIETNAAPLNGSALVVPNSATARVQLQLSAKTASGATVTSFSSSTALAVVRLA